MYTVGAFRVTLGPAYSRLRLRVRLVDLGQAYWRCF